MVDESGDQRDRSSVNARLCEAIEAYYAYMDAGDTPDHEALLAQYADVAEELTICLDSLEFVRSVAPQLSSDQHASQTREPSERPRMVALGDFQIQREIGRGGMGVVYEGYQLSLGRRVAVKVLPFAATLSNQQLQRFQNEARAAASLDHPNIVSVYFIGVERGVHYYAMQYIEGQSLATAIQELKQHAPKREGLQSDKSPSHYPSDAPSNVGPGQVTGFSDAAIEITSAYEHAQPSKGPIGMPPSAVSGKATSSDDTDYPVQAGISTCNDTNSPAFFQAVAKLGLQAAEALDYSHRHGIVHRDVKPANLLLDNRGDLYVADFGLARLESDATMTMSGELLGTLRYMSPEQAMAKRVVIDHRTDVYSLGITLYELSALHPAFPGEDRQELFRQIAFVDPPPLRQRNRHVPVDLATIVHKAIEKDPSDRYDTAQDLADDLNRFLRHEPIRARPITARKRVAKWSRRHRPVVWTATALLLLLTITSTISSLLVTTWYREATHQRDVARKKTNMARIQTGVAQRQRSAALAAEAAATQAREMEKKRHEQARENLYLADMRQAQRDWDEGRVDRMHTRLDRHIPESDQRDYRRWEWYYLLSLAHQDDLTIPTASTVKNDCLES